MQYDSLHDEPMQTLAGTQPVRVLLAEDDPVSQHVVTVLLDRLGYQRDLVTDGQEALIILTRRFYDIILLDLSMPGLDGISVAQRIRAGEAGGPRQYIIAISSSYDGDSRARCVAAGMDAFVPKPIALHTLDLALQRALRHRRNLAESERPADSETVSPPPARAHDSGEFGAGSRGAAPISRPQIRTGGPGEGEGDSGVPHPIATYLSRGQALLVTMRSASQSGDQDLLRRSALNLKGVARLLGAFELAALCAELETAPASATRSLGLEAVVEIEEEFGRVRSSLIAQSR